MLVGRLTGQQPGSKFELLSVVLAVMCWRDLIKLEYNIGDEDNFFCFWTYVVYQSSFVSFSMEYLQIDCDTLLFT